MKITYKELGVPQGISADLWHQWPWQLKNSIGSFEEIRARLELEKEEEEYFEQKGESFKFQVTPYYLELIKSLGPESGLRKILVPTSREFKGGHQSMLDPLGENKNRPHPRIIHRYPDRVLFLVTDLCAVYCRYCTRKHFTGQEQAFPKESEYQGALEYIKKASGIREVILSGGDPLSLSDGRLLKVLSDLREIDHVEIVRIGSRMPVVCPMRITSGLVQQLKEFHPIYIMTHFNHPDELTGEAAESLRLLVDNGFPVMNQMVLLNGVNNHEAIVQALSRRLLRLRVKPYYMFQCDPSQGTDHLRTSVENSLKIQRELWGRLSGLAMPTLSLDIPDGGGKATLVPEFEIERMDNVRRYRGWDGVTANYVSPLESEVYDPPDISKFQSEWESLKSGKS